MDNDYNVDIEEIAATIRSHEVVVLRFITIGQRLLLDFRCSDIDGPAVRLVSPVKSVQERYASLRKIRPRFRDPEKIVMVYWPRFTRSLGETEAWREVNQRLVDSGHPESVREAEQALAELVQLECEHQKAAVRGAEGFKTLWSRSPAPRQDALERSEFRRLVREAVALLPPELVRNVHNVEIVIERRPTARDRKLAGVGPGRLLLGLYHGIPITKRGEYYNLVAPDKISIYQEHIEAVCETDDEVREQVRKTVLHEIGHYFGIDDDRLHELGMG